MPSFNELPAELYDEIFQHVVYPSWEALNHISRSPTRDDIHSFDHLININRRPLEHVIAWWPRPGDIQLRLVSRAFNRAMLRVYFRYEGAVLLASEEHALERVEEHLIPEDGKSAWSIADSVEKFRVELCPRGYSKWSIFHADHGKMNEWEKRDGKDEKLDAGAERLKNLLDKATLARAVSRMPKLASLIVNLNEEWRAEDPAWDYDAENEEEMRGLKLKLDLLQSVREGVANLFLPVEFTVGGAQHLELLTYLRLALPGAYDFAYINKRMSEAVVMRLRHLYLEFIDGTGPGGDLDYTRSRQSGSDDGDEDYPLSNMQRMHPNTEYMHSMCSLVNRCKNLESLGLVGTQCIDLEGLNWHSANGGLKNIYICRAVTAADKMLQLLSSGYGEGSCAVEAFDIEDVQLMDSTWESVFARLQSSSTLVYFHVWNLVYSKHGTSAHLAENNSRPWENVSEIWTENRGDQQRIWDIIEAVMERGGSVSDVMASFDFDEDEDEYI
ncbi:hypothetical protein N0V90_012393 [Kalmusia sp. IMI 367209]|nr:hypothetical protein N0V90_012393 [Kalmusia sp. IMI 367209]